MFIAITFLAVLLFATLAASIAVGYIKQRRNPPPPLPANASPVLNRWATRIEADMPTELRTSPRWLAAKEKTTNCGREPEQEAARLSSIITWMWDSVLPLCQESTDQRGYGNLWRRMLEVQTKHTTVTTSSRLRASTFPNTKAAAAAAFTASLALDAKNKVAAAEAAAAVPRDSVVAAINFHPDIWERMDPTTLLETLTAT